MFAITFFTADNQTTSSGKDNNFSMIMENYMFSGIHDQYMQILRINGLCNFGKKQTSTDGSICASEEKP